MDALRLNTMNEKLEISKSAFMLRLMDNTYTRQFTKELIKCYNAVLHKTSTLHPILDYVSNTPLTRYLTISKTTDFSYDYQNQKCKNRFKYDETALTVRGMLWNLADQGHYLIEMLEPVSLRFEN